MSSEISEVVAGQVNERFLEVPTNSTYFADLATLNAAQSGAQNPFDAVVREVVDLRAAAGNMSAFDSRYVSKTDDEYVFISASSMAAVASSPTLSWVNGPEGRAVNPAWLMDASSVEFIAGAGVVPQHWSTFHVDLWWTNNASSSGDVVFQLMGVQYADGEQTDNDEINTGQITIAAPTTAGVAKVSRLTSVAITVSTDTVASFGLSRQATAGADTLANDAAVFGLMLVRAS